MPTQINCDFNDGKVPGDATKMKVPPQVLREGDMAFLRITGSRGDHESVPASYPDRNRSTIMLLSHYSAMPKLSASVMHQSYRARLRFHNNVGSDGVVFELYQNAPTGNTTYGTRDGKGPVVVMWRQDGHVIARANFANETKWDKVDLGYIAAGSWHTYEVRAVWSHDPKVGAIDILLDGKVKKSIRGRDVCLSPAADRIPTMKLGLYGDNSTGIVDVDWVQAGPTLPAPSDLLDGLAPEEGRGADGCESTTLPTVPQ